MISTRRAPLNLRFYPSRYPWSCTHLDGTFKPNFMQVLRRMRWTDSSAELRGCSFEFFGERKVIHNRCPHAVRRFAHDLHRVIHRLAWRGS